MIDFENKVIYFGYGDVAVSSCFMGYVCFANIKPPCECGESLTDRTDIEYSNIVKITEHKTHDLYVLFRTVSRENPVVKYDDYTFDFTNYNEESVNVCLEKAFCTVNPMLIAC